MSKDKFFYVCPKCYIPIKKKDIVCSEGHNVKKPCKILNKSAKLII